MISENTAIDARSVGENLLWHNRWNAPVGRQTAGANDHADALSLQIRLTDGSIGTNLYTSLGDHSFPKEYTEVFRASRVVTGGDFHRAVFVSDGKHRTEKLTRKLWPQALIWTLMPRLALFLLVENRRN